ncbi:ferredoxin [Nocardia sp. NPDC004860]|uniref:ferredoxin n=1 Tax=Nocardia sp. NPDC004860 TaxID=3154557 RepID=UPI0033AE8B46
MKLVVGQTCTGHGVCEGIRPDLFEVGSDGQVRRLTDAITEADIEDVEYAVGQCPARALALIRQP